ncbi:MAG TPA: rhomboid family intramembrane serine protease [Candidatus Limnocylindrales bacterium]|nr:rhomboid family intramembrane serine protease [Candidatus Limnocylindrales bacterium]
MTEPGFDPFHDPELDAAVATQGPLSTDVATRLVARGRSKLESGEAALSITDFQRAIGHEDPAVTGAALLGLGDAVYRLDDEGQARAAWEAATRLRDNPSTYRAWRNLAGVLVREGNLQAAINAYREADRRAPSEDKAEIASRLGWLAKETGNTAASGRYFARSRGGVALGLTQVLVLVTSAVSLLALSDPSGDLFLKLALDPDAIRHGELWRLLTVTLVHAPGSGAAWLSLHLLLNMYALWIIGPIVEGAWGRSMLLGFYVLCALAGSTASFVFSRTLAVGASGAIFGLVGVVLAGTRAHHPMLDQRARAIVPQLGMFVLINLVFGFAVTGAGGAIDNAAHVGGLLGGLWLGLLVPPGKVPTLRSAWQNPRGEPAGRSPLLIAAGIVLLLGVIAMGLALGGATL